MLEYREKKNKPKKACQLGNLFSKKRHCHSVQHSRLHPTASWFTTPHLKAIVFKSLTKTNMIAD